MIEHHLDKKDAILHVRPKAALEPSDFVELAKEVDPYIEDHGCLAGLMVETPGIPGWSSFAAMIAHLRFVKNHHRHIRKVAVVTDSFSLGDLAERVVSHLVSAEVRPFFADELEAARQWILEGKGEGEPPGVT